MLASPMNSMPSSDRTQTSTKYACHAHPSIICICQSPALQVRRVATSVGSTHYYPSAPCECLVVFIVSHVFQSR